MKKLRPILAIAALMASAGYSFSQDYRPGFIVRAGGDTTVGFVNYRVDKYNQRTCYFRATRHDKTTIYRPDELKAYGFSGDKYYESRVVDVGKGRLASRFFEVLVKGTASLLKYGGQLYLEKDSLILLPRLEGKLITLDEKKYIQPNKTYVALLNIALGDCQLSAYKTQYRDKDLTYLIQNYNRCKGEAGIVFKEKLEWTKFTPYIFSGIDNAHIQLTQFGPMKFRTSNSPVYGAGFNLSSPQLFSRTLVSVELWYTKKIYQGYSEDSEFGGVTRKDLYLHADLIKLPVSFVYHFTRATSTPYINLGFVQYVALHSSVQMISETENGGIVTTSHESPKKPDKNPTGYFVGAGFQRMISFGITCFAEVRFENNNGFAYKGSGALSSGQTLNLLFGLKF
jgi:hypothetical protein